MTALASLNVYFLDGTRVTFRYPKQAGTDPASIAATVKKAIDSEKLVLEVEGDLIVIPMKAVKYVRVSPAPDSLPQGVLRKARLIS